MCHLLFQLENRESSCKIKIAQFKKGFSKQHFSLRRNKIARQVPQNLAECNSTLELFLMGIILLLWFFRQPCEGAKRVSVVVVVVVVSLVFYR